MFGRSILIFIVLLICLVAGTALIIERETGVNLTPNKSQFISSPELRSFYFTNKIRFQYWWGKVSGENASEVHLTSVRYEKTDPKQPGIVKWQDEKGVWHFEYQKLPPPADNSSNK